MLYGAIQRVQKVPVPGGVAWACWSNVTLSEVDVQALRIRRTILADVD
jgi:hypothetical protein